MPASPQRSTAVDQVVASSAHLLTHSLQLSFKLRHPPYAATSTATGRPVASAPTRLGAEQLVRDRVGKWVASRLHGHWEI